MSSPEDIARLRQLKESESLENAWTAWKQTRKVWSFSLCDIGDSV
jgi:peptide chain release factor 1